MISKRTLCASLASLTFLVAVGATACFVDNPDRAQPFDDAGSRAEAATEDSSAIADARPDAPASDSGPPLCTKYGGYATIETVVGDLFGALVADCRISRFFTGLTSVRQGHLYDCLVKQVAVVTGCPGIKYDVDNAGVDCRDMITAHKGLSIRGADFDALIEDLVAVMLKDGVAQTDIGAIAPRLLALRDDIVTNSAPSHGKSICDASVDAGGDR